MRRRTLFVVLLAACAFPASVPAAPPAPQSCNGLDIAAQHVPQTSPGWLHLPTCPAA